jgi:ribosomal protein L37AE/L43A
MAINSCPYCGNRVLRHIRHKEIYWLCKSCREEIPAIMTNTARFSQTMNIQNQAQQAIESLIFPSLSNVI